MQERITLFCTCSLRWREATHIQSLHKNMAELNVKFVSKKISKIRWRPRSKQSMSQSNTFATGSWDDEDNKVCMWHLDQWVADSERHSEDDLRQIEPQLLCETQHPGDVTDMSFLTPEYIVASSSSGAVLLYEHQTKSQALHMAQQWTGLHGNGGRTCSCTCLATSGNDTIVTGGEDGRIAVLTTCQRSPIRILDKADSCTINSIVFLKQSEILTVNSFGQLKLFDLRHNSDIPVQIFSATEEHLALLCVDKHPGQPHVVATGGQDGLLTIWDLRQNRFPMTLLEAHASSMWEVRFHPYHAEHLFTCSEDGSLWHWDGSTLTSTSSKGTKSTENEEKVQSLCHQSPWLELETSRSKLEITSILPNKSLPVNSLDIEGAILVCGTDSENIYSINIPALI